MRQCYAATQDANSCTFCGNDRHKVNASDEGFVREICCIASGGESCGMLDRVLPTEKCASPELEVRASLCTLRTYPTQSEIGAERYF
jgi:hypothetical protein